MSEDNRPAPDRDDLVARWQYAIVWRYGALLLIVVGLGMIACAMAGVTAVSPDALLPTGLAALVSGVVLPRVKGRFSGPGKVALTCCHCTNSTGDRPISTPAAAWNQLRTSVQCRRAPTAQMLRQS
jgi:hypothetical protein